MFFLYSKCFPNSRLYETNIYVIGQIFKFQVFILKLCIKDGFLDRIVNSLPLALNLVCILTTWVILRYPLFV